MRIQRPRQYPRTPVRPWHLLGTVAREVVESACAEWMHLIEAPNPDERSCLEFLRNHANMVFCGDQDSYLVVNEIELGSDYRADFLLVKEGYSEGHRYTLIEIESPTARLFDSRGYKSKAFSMALDQIDAWRRWLKQNPEAARRLFPSAAWWFDGNPEFRFVIYMGRRNETRERRGQLSQIRDSQQITVRSLDAIADHIRDRPYTDFLPNRHPITDDSPIASPANAGANPFLCALSSAKWRDVCARSGMQAGHLTMIFIDEILPLLTTNRELERQFDALVPPSNDSG